MSNLRMTFTADQLNKLDCMNYQVDTIEGHYFLQCGRESLKRFCKEYNVNYIGLCRALLGKGQFNLGGEGVTITMI